MQRVVSLAVVLACLATAGPAAGQQTRAELLEQQRAERAARLVPYEPSKLEKGLLYIEEKRILERLGQGLSGIYPRIGGFTTGSGFALGAGFRHALPGTDSFEVDVSAAASMRGYKAIDFHVRAPALLAGRLLVDGGTHWWDYTQEDFFGLGESSRSDRTSYRYEGLQVNLMARLRPRRWLSFGEEVGYLRPDISSGTDARFPSVEQRFTDAQAPGLTRQPRLLYTRTFVDFDYRDQPGNTRSGGRVFLQVGTGRDQHASREFSYRRTDVEIIHVFPIFDKKRNFAVRLSGAHVDPLTEGGRVPFFLSPTIGGNRTLRSYRELRFRDATYVLLNGEYRWEAFAGLDLALFWDAGEVAPTLDRIRRDEFKTGWGFGLRFNTNRSVFMRIDVGLRGPEGSRIFWTFTPAF
ncbi:MAG: BamA/TamA family outer membrane protein [Vicinamibacterales bacterium]